MTEGPSIPPEVESLVPLFSRSKEKTYRTLVEFYESDWDTIKELKEQLDLSWKDFFHAIAVWMRTLKTDEAAITQVTKLLRPEGKA